MNHFYKIRENHITIQLLKKSNRDSERLTLESTWRVERKGVYLVWIWRMLVSL
jgi:hypothetical protein